MSFKYNQPRKRHFVVPEDEKKKNVSIGLPVAMINFYKELADKSGLTFTDIVTDVLDQVAEQIQANDKVKQKR